MEGFEHLAGKRILVAEDDLLNKMIMRKILEKLPVEFKIVDNGKLALDLISNQEFDMVFLDIQMPVMDGYMAAKCMRALPQDASKHIPILALTASISNELEQMVKASGMDDFLVKPFSPEALYAKIKEYLK